MCFAFKADDTRKMLPERRRAKRYVFQCEKSLAKSVYKRWRFLIVL